MNIDPSIFKAYDIRGTFPNQINAATAEAIGRVLADFLPGKGGVAVGRDMRTDSNELAGAIIRGLTAQGRTVVDIGLVSTDMAYFASGFYDLAGAAMITASHNPGQYNGIKLCGTQAAPIGVTTGLKQIQSAVMKGRFNKADQPGTVQPTSIDTDWVRHALGFVNTLKWPDYRIGVDAGNGMMGKIFPLVQQQVEKIKVTPLFFELDGTFPNHPANPAIEANLADLITSVNSGKLDLGIAFDGDGDRAFFVDETGTPLSGSVAACILIQRTLERHPGSTILFDVRMSKIVPETIERLGGKAVRTPVGGGYIRPEIRKVDGALATEGAGHYYFRDNYYSDSGLITALTVIDMMAEKNLKLSQLAAPYRAYEASGEISVQVPDPEAVLEKVAAAYQDGKQDRLDGLTVDMGEWWFNLRPSHTEPLIRLNLEGTTHGYMGIKRDEVLRLIKGQ